MKQRLASIDVVRLVAVVAIVWGHTFPASEFKDRFIMSWHLPVFFVLTGYFWSDRRSIGEVARARFRTLLVPYALWFVLITVFSLPRMYDGDILAVARTVAFAALGGSYAKQPYTTFWFFTALFVAAIVYRILRRFPTVVRVAVVAVGLLVNVVAGEQLARVPYAVATAFGALAFLEAGRIVRMLEQTMTVRQRAAVGLGAVGVALGVLSVVPGDFAPVDMKSGHFPAFAIVLSLVLTAAIVLAATAWTSVPEQVGSVVSVLAMVSLFVIFLHPLVLYYLGADATDLPLLLVFAVALLVPFALGLLVKRTRLAPLLIGVEALAPRTPVFTAK